VRPQDLPREHARVLCVRAVFGIAGRDVQVAVGTELEATAIVSVIARDPVEDDRLLCPESILVAHANDLVSSHSVRRPVAVVEVDESALREVGVESDPEKPLLAVAAGARGGGARAAVGPRDARARRGPVRAGWRQALRLKRGRGGCASAGAPLPGTGPAPD